MKSERQARILEIIAKYEVQTQDEITARLQAEGFKVTQATVSRDLRDLKLTKSMSSSGKYRYTAAKIHDHVGMVKLNNAMLESIVNVRYSLNNVVIKTFPGMANALAVCVDALEKIHIVGSVAGDDTILLVVRSEEIANDVAKELKEAFSV